MSIDPGRNRNPGVFTGARARKDAERIVHAELIAVADPPEGAEGWRLQALCAQTDPDAFFPEAGGSPRQAKKICAACPVVAECLDYALTNEEHYGVWGGKSERERRAIERGPRKTKRSTARDARAQQVRALTAEGHTDAEVSVRLGIAERTVARIRKDYGIKPHPFNAARGRGEAVPS